MAADVAKAAKAAAAEATKAVAELEKLVKETKPKFEKYTAKPSEHPNDTQRLIKAIAKTLETWEPQLEKMNQLLNFAVTQASGSGRITQMNARYSTTIAKMVPGLKAALAAEQAQRE